MRIIRVFPRRTSLTPGDALAFVGYPSMFLPSADEVHISCCFVWDMLDAELLALAWSQYYPSVRIGGPAYGNSSDGFTPGLYVKPGVTFTSRGCNNQCPWCLVPAWEGKLRELPVVAGNIVQDNNLLQCSRSHLGKVFAMLRTQHRIQFTGGLDARRVTDDIADSIRGLRISQVFLACDTKEAIVPLRLAIKKLFMPRDKVRCYVLLRFDQKETISGATERMLEIWEAGAMPFAQLYQPGDRWREYSPEWRHFARTWSRPAAMKAAMKEVPGQ